MVKKKGICKTCGGITCCPKNTICRSCSHKGKTHSVGTRKKQSDGLKGIPKSEEHRKKLSESHLGMHPSENAKEKMSNSKKGESNSFYGKKHSTSTKEKMSLKHKGVFVSIETRIKISFAEKGEKHHNWKGGITPTTQRIRTCTRYVEWRDAVFARDNYTCKITGQHGGNLEAHHTVPFATLMKAYKIKTLEDAEACDALWCIDNGITLSKKVHKELHRR